MAVSSSRRALFSSAMTFGEPLIMPRSIAPRQSGVSRKRRGQRRKATRAAELRLNEFEAGKEIADFERSGFRSVGAVRHIVADAGAEVVADGTGCRFFGIGGAHGLAPLQNGSFRLEDHRNDLAGGHELGQLAEERALPVDGIK